MPLMLVVPRLRKYAAGDIIEEDDVERMATRYSWAVAEVSDAEAQKAEGEGKVEVLRGVIDKLAAKGKKKPNKAKPAVKPKPEPAPEPQPTEEVK